MNYNKLLDALLEPLPPPEQLRATALAVLRCVAGDPGADPAVRQDAAEALRKAHDALFELIEVAGELGEDERRVLVAIARRLALGRKAYGPLDVQGDARSWRAEAGEELLDGCVYLACEALRQRAVQP